MSVVRLSSQLVKQKIHSQGCKLIVLVFMTSLFSACASNKVNQQLVTQDPLEKVNRATWDFNYKVLDKHVVKPTAKGYEKLGLPIRNSISNVLLNLEEPLYALNNLLQGKVKDSGTSVGRFAINSTIGLLGIFDIAQKWNLHPKREDFGQTLGAWGVGNGGFVVLPVYGPTTPRNFTGDVLDTLVYPVSLLNSSQLLLNFTLKGLERRVQLFNQDPLIERSLDSYNFIKEVYFQNDAYKISDQQPNTDVEIEDDDLLFDDEPLIDDTQMH